MAMMTPDMHSAGAKGDTAAPTGDTVLRLTDDAMDAVLGIRADEPDATSMALWVEINGTDGPEYAYDIWFQAATDAGTGDTAGVQGELVVVIPGSSVERMQGATLAVDGDGLVIRNPNRPTIASGTTYTPAAAASPAMGAAPADLSGDVPQRVIRVLEEQINPSIAAHGGRADLVAVDDGVAYLRLSGGCAGCGMAAVTLNQGIAVALREAVPEVTSVVDVTDHASGSNPYYEPAKK